MMPIARQVLTVVLMPMVDNSFTLAARAFAGTGLASIAIQDRSPVSVTRGWPGATNRHKERRAYFLRGSCIHPHPTINR
jgi:hypothetical protein